MVEKENRHRCIMCGKKRFQRYLRSFTFVSWSTPVSKSRVKHYACSINIGYKSYNEPTCMDKLLKMDFNPVIMP